MPKITRSFKELALARYGEDLNTAQQADFLCHVLNLPAGAVSTDAMRRRPEEVLKTLVESLLEGGFSASSDDEPDEYADLNPAITDDDETPPGPRADPPADRAQQERQLVRHYAENGAQYRRVGVSQKDLIAGYRKERSMRPTVTASEFLNRG
jgi:hypothetical protein